MENRWNAALNDAIPAVNNFESREKLMKAVIQKFNNGLLDNNL